MTRFHLLDPPPPALAFFSLCFYLSLGLADVFGRQQNINCGAAAQCEVGESQSLSYSIGWSASAEAYEWISGGFDVSVSWETGKNYGCTAGSGETLCLWCKSTASTPFQLCEARTHGMC